MRTGSWVLAAVVAAAVGFALWTGSSVPDPVGRGSSAPAFALRELPGPGELSLASLRGQVVLLNFWATWCEPCEREMPAMQRLHEKLGPEGLRLVAVSVDDTSDVVDSSASASRSRSRSSGTRTSASRTPIRPTSYPETLLIGRDGVVVERYIGPRDWDSPLYEARIRRLLEEK